MPLGTVRFTTVTRHARIESDPKMTSTTQTPEPAPRSLTDPPTPSDRTYQRRWWTLAVLCLSLVVIGVDNTILNVALPTLVKDLQEFRIDCRPSDGIALALRAGAPISVEQGVLETAAQAAGDLPPLVGLETFYNQ